MNPRIVIAGLVGFLTAAPAGLAEERADEGQWIQLFNGKDLKDWKVKITGYELGDNFGETFRVEDGVLKVSYDGYQRFEGRFGHIFYDGDFGGFGGSGGFGGEGAGGIAGVGRGTGSGESVGVTTGAVGGAGLER